MTISLDTIPRAYQSTFLGYDAIILQLTPYTIVKLVHCEDGKKTISSIFVLHDAEIYPIGEYNENEIEKLRDNLFTTYRHHDDYFDDDVYDNSDSESDKDFTACSVDDCGFCGKCDY
jgi:hypothetical protein